ncbi:CD74 molecule, major histocompatibility complex, class II invariant chain b [Symphorus nematophorus]
MSDPETQTPLIRAQAATNGPAGESGRSSRAYKVAGLTLLACILIAGQVMVAYFLLSQRSDIKSLEEQSNNLKAELTKGRSVSVPMRTHVPIATLPEMMVDAVDEDAPEKTGPPATECQLEAAGVKPPRVPGFKPACDERGFYKAQQCYLNQCWCVDPVSGHNISGSERNGPALCSGHLSKVMNQPDVMV